MRQLSQALEPAWPSRSHLYYFPFQLWESVGPCLATPIHISCFISNLAGLCLVPKAFRDKSEFYPLPDWPPARQIQLSWRLYSSPAFLPCSVKTVWALKTVPKISHRDGLLRLCS